ncbi:MAG: hypothetical protein EOP17_01120 [Rhizobiaceae bacterium]|nr:MAG: hypothetical protein EOP17_01120 [Rhizobiaceae bacterium]
MKPTMVVLAGPNGAGKSTLYKVRVAPSFAGPFINADIIQRDELRDPSPEASYEAAQIATSQRAEYLAQAAVLKADRGMVFDNSRLNQPANHCLTFSDGRLVFALPHLPGWIRSVYATDLII